VAQSSKDNDSLVYLHLADSNPERELVTIRHLQSYQSRGVNHFLRMLREGVMAKASN
jgi:hypothetical protein